MSPDRLIRLQAELEYGVLLRGNDIPITAENAGDVPLVTVVRHALGYVKFLPAGVPSEQRALFDAFPDPVLYDALASTEPFNEIGEVRVVSCCWYCVSRIPDAAEFLDVTRRGDRFVIERDGVNAAEAWSAQDDARAAEVEVETASRFRRRGFGRQVVAAWAHSVRRDGKIALYSHLTSNDASRALARSIGAWQYAETRELF